MKFFASCDTRDLVEIAPVDAEKIVGVVIQSFPEQKECVNGIKIPQILQLVVIRTEALYRVRHYQAVAVLPKLR